jgi:GT2 family glycosyltransferase
MGSPADSSVSTVPVSAIVTAFRRPAAAIDTLTRLRACNPAPAEILVHVDGNQVACAEAIRAALPGVRMLISEANVGPGGGRNRLIDEASHELVSSFDDDSYPLDHDFFGRVVELMARHPDAGVLAGRVFQKDQAIEPASRQALWVADFEGGGATYRRSAFQRGGGYVPLPIAYGMEEVDLALRLHARGVRILRTGWLRIYHDADLSRHADPEVTAASVRNLALLAFLRYPAALWPIGVTQILNRVQWLLRNGRSRGIVEGLLSLPSAVWSHRARRTPLPAAVVRSYFQIRRHPVAAS